MFSCVGFWWSTRFPCNAPVVDPCPNGNHGISNKDIQMASRVLLGICIAVFSMAVQGPDRLTDLWQCRLIGPVPARTIEWPLTWLRFRDAFSKAPSIPPHVILAQLMHDRRARDTKVANRYIAVFQMRRCESSSDTDLLPVNRIFRKYNGSTRNWSHTADRVTFFTSGTRWSARSLRTSGLKFLPVVDESLTSRSYQRTPLFEMLAEAVPRSLLEVTRKASFSDTIFDLTLINLFCRGRENRRCVYLTSLLGRAF